MVILTPSSTRTQRYIDDVWAVVHDAASADQTNSTSLIESQWYEAGNYYRNFRFVCRFDTTGISPSTAELVIAGSVGDTITVSDIGAFIFNPNVHDPLDELTIYGLLVTGIGSVELGKFSVQGRINILPSWSQTAYFNVGLVTDFDYDNVDPKPNDPFLIPASGYPRLEYTPTGRGIGRTHAKHPAWIF